MRRLLQVVFAMAVAGQLGCGGDKKPGPDVAATDAAAEVEVPADANGSPDVLPDSAPADFGGDVESDSVGDMAIDDAGDTAGDIAPDAADLADEDTPPDNVETLADAEDLVPEVLADTTDATEIADAGKDALPAQPCELDYDCDPGQTCTLGFCEEFQPECGKDGECGLDETCVDGICLGKGVSPMAGAIVFNEVLADGNTDGDPNQDGTYDPMEDEFVELVNIGSTALDVSGWMLVETDWEEWLPRYTFPKGTVISPKRAIVLFGGGDAPESTDAVFFDASNAGDPGIPYGLDLDDSGDKLRLLDGEGLAVAVFAYGNAGGTPATSDMSLTRSPDLTGSFAPHVLAEGAGDAIFSPGTRVDGKPF